ncbi:MAG: bacteriorhodopsin [Bacteroidetes Order II. Incertae sedis bacterium]|nr:bacteriorhodopsin [Bacteroidetes Order II. bacterium]
MDALSVTQYDIVFNALSFTFASMLAAFVFFIIARERVAKRYRISLMVSAIVVGIAAYHYFRILGSWEHAATYVDGAYSFNGDLFNDAYRYVDWLLTVPLLLVELVLVMGLASERARKLVIRLSAAAVAMILLGYPGEGATTAQPIVLWGVLSTIPFTYILYVLWGEIGKAIQTHSARVADLMIKARYLLLASWGFYPITYGLPLLGADVGLVGMQVGYAVADVVAKAGFGLLIYAIARNKSEEEGYSLTD